MMIYNLPQIMESAIGLCYCSPYPTLSLCNGSKGFPNASSTRFHNPLFNHASLRASHFSTIHPLATRSLPLANCNIIPSKNNNNKVLRGVTRISVVLACVIGLFNFNSKMNPLFNTAYAASIGGLAAVESLLETVAAPPSQTVPKYKGEPSQNQVEELKLHASGKSKSGDPRLGVLLLENKLKECQTKGWHEAEYNLEMALIQLLITQGKFEDARKRVDNRINELLAAEKVNKDAHRHQSKIDKLLHMYIQSISQSENYFLADKVAQLILYKAIAQSMYKHKSKEAAKWWQAFAELHVADKNNESSSLPQSPP